jgi:glutamine synthetase
LTDSGRHIHVSLRNADGKNSFAVLEDDVKIGRAKAAYNDTKFISQEAEWFLAGVLDGLAEGVLGPRTILY